MTCTRVLCVAMLLATPLLAQPDPRVRKAAESITAATLMRDVSYLASDELRGRATPSPGLDSAAAFVIRRLVQLGVPPAGDAGGYRQYYDVIASTLDTVATTIRMGAARLRWGSDFLVTQFRVPGQFRGGIVYVGNGVQATGRGLDPYAALDVQGKWLLLHSSQAFLRGPAPDSLGRHGLDYTTAIDEAKARGALGLLVIASASDVHGWEAMRAVPRRSRELNPSVGRAATPFPLPIVLLSERALMQVLASEGARGAAVLTANAAGRAAPSFTLRSLTPLILDVGGTVEHRGAYNVVAVIPGADSSVRDEWISVSTHLDGAVGRLVVPGGDSIFNAADDNASGSAGNLSIARALLDGPRPRRTILLVWDSGEETGLLGTRFLAYGPLGRRIVAHFTVDMIARTRAPGTQIAGQSELTGPGAVFVSGPGVLSTVMDAALATVSRSYPYVRFDRRYEDPSHEFFYPRTDAAPYVEQGIPYAEFFTGLHEDYHQPSDEESKLDPVKFEAVARSVYATVWTVANGMERPRIDKPLPPSLWFVVPR